MTQTKQPPINPERFIPPHLVQDPLERNVPGFNLGRDPERTPLPWSSEPHGGFTDGQLWLPLNADAERDEPHQSTRRYTGGARNELPAYVANGMVGLRVREMPLSAGLTLLSGYRASICSDGSRQSRSRRIRSPATSSWEAFGVSTVPLCAIRKAEKDHSGRDGD